MKKSLLAVSALAAVAVLSGCATPDTWGGLYSANTGHHIQATDNKIGSKKGESKLTNIIGIAEGDISLATAAANGGVTKIATVDIKVKNILSIYSETTLVVTGE
ncbi:MAG: TRL-like family protein [Puniceicoccales bacterium]|jgi:outer membrane lipoprotein SlyB|nr:TRL-like family protein [Puniceicoccales bacterium]